MTAYCLPREALNPAQTQGTPVVKVFPQSPHPVLSGVVAVSAGEDVLVEADDGEDVGVQQELAVAHHLGRELPHPRLPVGKVHRHLQVDTFLGEI